MRHLVDSREKDSFPFAVAAFLQERSDWPRWETRPFRSTSSVDRRGRYESLAASQDRKKQEEGRPYVYAQAEAKS